MDGGFGRLPQDAFTFEELRVFFASVKGPLRVSQAVCTPQPLIVGQAVRVAANGQGPPLYVELRGQLNVAAPDLVVGASQGVNAQNGIAVDLSIGPFGQILIPAEELWVNCIANASPVIVCVITP